MSALESFTLSYLLNSLWQVPLLFATGWLIVRLLRRTHVGVEHRVWASTLLLQSLLPACSALPWPGLRSLLHWFGPDASAGDPRVSVVLGSGAPLNLVPLPASLLTAIAIAYGAVCAYFLVRFIWRCRRLVRLRRAAQPIPLSGEIASVWRQCSQRFGVQNALLGASSQIFGPVTLGVRKKLVLLPADMLAGLPESDLLTIIAHEFAHLRRSDFVKNLFYEAVSVPVSFHPLLWRTRERMMESREIVCDAMAAETSGRNEYAHSLLRLASMLVGKTPIQNPPAIGIFDANSLERRLMRLTEKQHEIQGARRLVVIAVCLLFGAGICASALTLATNVSETTTASGDSPKAKERQTVPASEMAKYIVYKVPPVYPQDAKEARIQGKVVLDAIIGKDGAVENLGVVSGPNELQQSALDAVRQWKYKPFLVNGDPVEVKTTINVIYSLAN